MEVFAPAFLAEHSGNFGGHIEKNSEVRAWELELFKFGIFEPIPEFFALGFTSEFNGLMSGVGGNVAVGEDYTAGFVEVLPRLETCETVDSVEHRGGVGVDIFSGTAEIAAQVHFDKGGRFGLVIGETDAQDVDAEVA